MLLVRNEEGDVTHNSLLADRKPLRRQIDSYRKMFIREPNTELMNDHAVHREHSTDKEEISIHLDSELLEQIHHLTNDPSKVIETAIRQWLRGERERDDELTRTLERNPPVPLRGEWND